MIRAAFSRAIRAIADTSFPVIPANAGIHERCRNVPRPVCGHAGGVGGRWPLVLLLLLAAMFLAACGGSKHPPIPRGATVLVIGDSITAGFGLGPDKAWTATLATASGWNVVNAGISGDTTDGGRARLGALLDEHRPVAVIVELGGNDMLRRQSTATTVANLEAMLDAAAAAGARPVLMATPEPSLAAAVFSSLSDAPFYAEIAKRKKLPLVDEAIAEVLSKPELKLDKLHPNAEGHVRLGTAVVEKLRKLGLIAG